MSDKITNNQDIIRFVVDTKFDSLQSAIVIITEDNKVYSNIVGEKEFLAALLAYVAIKNNDFKQVLITAIGTIGLSIHEGGDNGTLS